MKILLDTTPLWTLVHPAGGAPALALRTKITKSLQAGDEVAIAEISDYEARRELLRKRATKQIHNLDELIENSVYLPIDTNLMRSAASLWALLRQSGKPTAPNERLDGDVILAAQALRFTDHLVVTKNVKHLVLLCNAVDMEVFSKN